MCFHVYVFLVSFSDELRQISVVSERRREKAEMMLCHVAFCKLQLGSSGKRSILFGGKSKSL